MEMVRITRNVIYVFKALAQKRSKWRSRIYVADPTLLGQGINDNDADFIHMFYK